MGQWAWFWMSWPCRKQTCVWRWTSCRPRSLILDPELPWSWTTTRAMLGALWENLAAWKCSVFRIWSPFQLDEQNLDLFPNTAYLLQHGIGEHFVALCWNQIEKTLTFISRDNLNISKPGGRDANLGGSCSSEWKQSGRWFHCLAAWHWWRKVETGGREFIWFLKLLSLDLKHRHCDCQST